ncbi:hypothetical protein OEZ86_002275 [Tetradesmus obliquus]|nr:hypothetical protein OEZ86_002275 [Tetradesmus obliquus]
MVLAVAVPPFRQRSIASSSPARHQEPDVVDCVVVGAGVVGLACARAAAQAGLEVVLLEQEASYGTATSSRHSEVIHAGIYYPAGSLKARFCVQGKQLLYEYCKDKGIAHSNIGKLIVAANERQLPQLLQLKAFAAANGVTDLQLLSGSEAAAAEPELAAAAALLSPSTGILDSHGYMAALLADAEAAGAVFATHSRVLGAQALPVAGMPRSAVPKQYLAKGSYFTCAQRAPFSRLIYPLPEDGGLGVHLTLDLAGQAKFGPDVEWVDRIDYSVDPRRAAVFYPAIRSYWPGLQDHSLQPGYCGVRPKTTGPGQPAADFVLAGEAQHGVHGLVCLYGIESPGLTSSLALAEAVLNMLQ